MNAAVSFFRSLLKVQILWILPTAQTQRTAHTVFTHLLSTVATGSSTLACIFDLWGTVLGYTSMRDSIFFFFSSALLTRKIKH